MEFNKDDLNQNVEQFLNKIKNANELIEVLKTTVNHIESIKSETKEINDYREKLNTIEIEINDKFQGIQKNVEENFNDIKNNLNEKINDLLMKIDASNQLLEEKNEVIINKLNKSRINQYVLIILVIITLIFAII